MSGNTNGTLSFPEFWLGQHLFLEELSLILGFSSFLEKVVNTLFFLPHCEIGLPCGPFESGHRKIWIRASFYFCCSLFFSGVEGF